jgi:hypothetical protein
MKISGRSGEIQTTRHLGAPYPSHGGKGKETGHPHARTKSGAGEALPPFPSPIIPLFDN